MTTAHIVGVARRGSVLGGGGSGDATQCHAVPGSPCAREHRGQGMKNWTRERSAESKTATKPAKPQSAFHWLMMPLRYRGLPNFPSGLAGPTPRLGCSPALCGSMGVGAISH